MEYKEMACLFQGEIRCASSLCEECDARELFECMPAVVTFQNMSDKTEESSKED